MLHLPTAPWAVPADDGLHVLLLGDLGADGNEPAFLRALPDNEELLLPLQPDGRHAGRPRWRGTVPWDHGNAVTLYSFVLASAQGHRWLAADGEHALVPAEAVHFRHHPTQEPPAWVRDQVFYQVFPDRFARGDPPAPFDTALQPWGAPPPLQDAGSAFYGGDLVGLRQQLPYLNDELGVTALYLNPVFDSPSNHRYDTRDYTRVCQRLGGDNALLALRQALQARGMRLVLDAVVNHTGAEHAWAGAANARNVPNVPNIPNIPNVPNSANSANSANAPQAHYYARGADGQPLGWKGHASLPVLDFSQPAVQQAVYAAPDAILRRWLQPPWSIDGWRLDVVHMLGEGPGARHNALHVRAIRQAVLAENPQAYLLGEHFIEATRWLQGDQEDGAMNYHGFTTPVRAWLAGLDVGGRRALLPTDAFAAALGSAIARIPYANQLAQMNLLDSHDTPRLLTELGGASARGLARLALAFTLLFTRPGVPCIYYGDETGLQGGPDPDNRRCFDWDRSHWSQPIWQHVRGLVALRQSRHEWRQGAVLPLAHGKDWLAYARCTGAQATVVVLNRGTARGVTIPLDQVPVLTKGWQQIGQAGLLPEGPARLRLPAAGATLLLSTTKE